MSAPLAMFPDDDGALFPGVERPALSPRDTRSTETRAQTHLFVDINGAPDQALLPGLDGACHLCGASPAEAYEMHGEALCAPCTTARDTDPNPGD